MDLSSPVGGVNILNEPSESNDSYKPLFHSGTYNGHPLIMGAGLKTIEILGRENFYAELETQTQRLRQGIEQLTQKYGLPVQTIGVGSIFNLIFSTEPITQIQDVLASDLSKRKTLDNLLIKHGIFVKPMNRFSMSSAHDHSIIDQTLERFEAALKEMTNQ